MFECPKCHAILEQSTSFEKVYACPQCKGILASTEEVYSYIKSIKDAVPEIKNYLSRIDVKIPILSGEEKLNCPVCNLKMDKFNYAYDSNVLADRCRKCNLIWLDSKEDSELASHFLKDPKETRIAKAYAQMVPETFDPFESTEDKSFTAAVTKLTGVDDETPPFRIPFVTILFFFYMFLGIMALNETEEILWVILYITAVGNVWIFGPNVEDSMGHVKYLLFGALVVFLISLYGFFTVQEIEVVVYIYCIVSSLLGSYLALYPFQPLKIYGMGDSARYPFLMYAIFWLFMNIFYLVFSKENTPLIPLSIIGFTIGYVITAIMKKIRLLRITNYEVIKEPTEE